jgi:hypothetical protein
LADQRANRVLDALRIATINEALRQPIDQTNRLIGALEQQRACIRADRPAIERRDYSATLNA